MLLHGVGERGAALDVLTHGEEHFLEVRVVLLASQDLETLDQRQTGVDHDGELTREDRDVLAADASAELGEGNLLPFLLDAGDENLLPPKHRDYGILGIRGAFA